MSAALRARAIVALVFAALAPLVYDEAGPATAASVLLAGWYAGVAVAARLVAREVGERTARGFEIIRELLEGVRGTLAPSDEEREVKR